MTEIPHMEALKRELQDRMGLPPSFVDFVVGEIRDKLRPKLEVISCPRCGAPFRRTIIVGQLLTCDHCNTPFTVQQAVDRSVEEIIESYGRLFEADRGRIKEILANHAQNILLEVEKLHSEHKDLLEKEELIAQQILSVQRMVSDILSRVGSKDSFLEPIPLGDEDQSRVKEIKSKVDALESSGRRVLTTDLTVGLASLYSSIDTREALKMVEKAYQSNPQNENVRLFLAKCYLDVGEDGLALRLIDSLDPNIAGISEYCILYGERKLNFGEIGPAIDLLRRAASRTNDPKVLVRIADLCMRSKFSVLPTNQRLSFGTVLFPCRINRRHAVVRLDSEGLSLTFNPKVVGGKYYITLIDRVRDEFFYLLGYEEIQQAKKEGAYVILHLTRPPQVTLLGLPTDITPHNILRLEFNDRDNRRTFQWEIEQRMGVLDRDLAESCYRRALELQPGNVMAWIGLSEIADGEERKLKYLRKALEFDPSNEVALRRIDLYQRLMNKFQG